MTFTLIRGAELKEIPPEKLEEYFGLSYRPHGPGSIRLTNVNAPDTVIIARGDEEQPTSPVLVEEEVVLETNGNGSRDTRLRVSVTTIVEDGQLIIIGDEFIRFQADENADEQNGYHVPASASHRFQKRRPYRRARKR